MATTETDPHWSVALSGGGHRAALYGAGALLCLVDTDVHKQVCSVASVSGGSLTNGVLAQSPTPFSSMTREQYLGTIGPLLKRCAYKGTVESAWEVYAWAAAVLGLLAVTIAVPFDNLWKHLDKHLPGFASGHGWSHALAFVIVLAVLLYVISVRSWIADRVFRRLLFSPNGSAVKLRSPATSATDQCPTSPVLHVFCASELQSRVHAYFSPAFVYSHDFKVSKKFDLHLSTAVQASSNFPPVFPARRLPAKKLGLTPPPGASKLLLTDGGVYDNMAEEWIVGGYGRAPEDLNPDLVPVVGQMPNRMLVVNASKRDPFKKAGWFLSLPLLGEAGVLLRISSLMHQVTTTNRRERLIAEFDARRTLNQVALDPETKRAKLEQQIGIRGALTHIGTPADFIARLQKPPIGGTFGNVRQAFDALTSEQKQWVTESHDTALSIGTRLNGTGEQAAASLLWQGYVLTLVNMYLGGYVTTFALPTKADMVTILQASRDNHS